MAWSLDGIAAWQRGCWTTSRCGDVAIFVVSRKLHRLKRSRRGRLDGVAAWRPMWFPHGCRGWTASRRGRLGGVTAWRRGSGTASRRGASSSVAWALVGPAEYVPAGWWRHPRSPRRCAWNALEYIAPSVQWRLGEGGCSGEEAEDVGEGPNIYCIVEHGMTETHISNTFYIHTQRFADESRWREARHSKMTIMLLFFLLVKHFVLVLSINHKNLNPLCTHWFHRGRLLSTRVCHRGHLRSLFHIVCFRY